MNIWEILEINNNADEKAIKRAYAKLCAKYHPEEYPEKFEEIKNAYENAIKIAKVKKDILEQKATVAEKQEININFTQSSPLFEASQQEATPKHDKAPQPNETTLLGQTPKLEPKQTFDEFVDLPSDTTTTEQQNFYENFVMYLSKMPLLDYASIYTSDANKLSFEFHGKWNTLILSDYFYTAMIYFPEARNRFITYLDEIYTSNQYTHKILIENILRANIYKMPQEVQTVLYACVSEKYKYSLNKNISYSKRQKGDNAAFAVLMVVLIAAVTILGATSSLTGSTGPSSSEQLQQMQNNADVLSATIVDTYQTQHGIAVTVKSAEPLIVSKFSYTENTYNDYYEFLVTRIYPEKQKYTYMPETVSVIIPADYTDTDLQNYLANDEFQHLALYFLTFELKLTNQKYNTLPADWYTWQDNTMELNYFYSAEDLYASLVLFQDEVTSNPYLTDDIVLTYVYESHADDPEYDNLRETYFPFEIVIKKDGSTDLDAIKQQFLLIDAEIDIASEAWFARAELENAQ